MHLFRVVLPNKIAIYVLDALLQMTNSLMCYFLSLIEVCISPNLSDFNGYRFDRYISQYMNDLL